MSLEIAIQENTAAINALIAILGAKGFEPAAAPAPKEAPATKKEKATPKVEEAPEPATVAEAVTYDQAAEAIQQLAKTKGRDAAIAVLKQFGASKLPDVDAKDFAAVVAACGAV